MEMLRELGISHVIAHEGAYLDTEGRDTTTALHELGAAEIFRDRAPMPCSRCHRRHMV